MGGLKAEAYLSGKRGRGGGEAQPQKKAVRRGRQARAGRAGESGRATKGERRAAEQVAADLFAEFGEASGLGAAVWIVESRDGGWDVAHHQSVAAAALTAPAGRAKRRSGRGGRGVLISRTCSRLAAAGHVTRAVILQKLLEGPAIYRSLQRVTGLRAGPLYHHVNQLRLAGLLLPKQRDLYELTRAGRNLILTVLALAPLLDDKRRRPIGPIGT